MPKLHLFKFFPFFILVSFRILSPQPVLAHGTGLIPFFRINNIYPTEFGLYRVKPSSHFLTIPQDLAPQNYLVNQSINFLIDKNQLKSVLTSDTVDNITFSWDFGDKQMGSGIQNTHTYTKPGSYILEITADYHNLVAGKQVVESVLLNILAISNYPLPTAQILVNGNPVKNPENNVLEINLNQSINLSVSSNQPALTYTWDLGDNTSNSNKVLSHSYNFTTGSVTSTVLVKDSQGFISYGWVNLVNSQNQNGVETQLQADQQSKQKNLIYLTASLAMIILTILGILILRKKKVKS